MSRLPQSWHHPHGGVWQAVGLQVGSSQPRLLVTSGCPSEASPPPLMGLLQWVGEERRVRESGGFAFSLVMVAASPQQSHHCTVSACHWI